MKVIFKAPQKLGGRSYGKGEQVVPDNLAYNLGFKKLVAAGGAQVMARDAQRQQVQMSKDMKAIQKAKSKYKAAKAAKALKSAQAASGASPTHPSAAGAAQPLPTPAKPIQARAAVKVSAPAALATAPGKKG